MTTATRTVWSDLVGQRPTIEVLRHAAADPDHYVVLDARAPIDEIAGAIHERVEPLLGAS